MVSNELNKIIQFNREKPDVYGNAHPKYLLRAIMEDGTPLEDLANQHIYSAEQFSRETLLQLFRLAAKYEANPDRFSNSLQGQILISAFYEPSTRTRLSFESAWHRLGGDIMSITDRSTTGIAKGESLRDVAEMFNNYGDCVVLRDSNEQSVKEMMDALRIPIINAGNGLDEHPTQALADLYTIFKWRPDLLDDVPSEPIDLCIIGMPSKMRTVRSLLKLIIPFANAFHSITIIANQDEQQVFSQGQQEQIEQAGIRLKVTGAFHESIKNKDVIYINAIAWEDDTFKEYGKHFQLNSQSPLKKSSIILHPLARGEELCPTLDKTPHNWYFAQARGAVFMRQALLTCLVLRAKRVLDII
ncbi:aspartate carbamoyltransferase [Pseudoalteromonas sp. MMG024]|uniref:aspartate/ornithine carbamoyltransferase family protein n=1 Tax=Pseudoalteromonas sp. MMG024 TaxID=2909980 RepID=UPI001F326492|nr:aspartate carbamoyltransferase [Pseudoalteromonas sp. MMG024]MCF6458926.1 aspartate carbamoyltransferase [Pseudoalteromonas sp. MMG024]